MILPGWARRLVRRFAPEDRADDLVGDLEEAHRERVVRRGHLAAWLLTALEVLDLTRALVWERVRRASPRMSLLDLKLSFRMLVRYPGLTVVGGIAMAFAIWVAAGTFEILYQVVRPQLPLPGGDRIVALRLVDAATGREEPRALFDLEVWQQELGSVEALGAYAVATRNLVVPGGTAEPVELAQVTATAFDVAPVPPLLGRALDAGDEEAGAPPVLVIGFEAWQGYFGGVPDVVGRVVRVGDTQTTVVGVMPEGFAFPRADALWTPLPRGAGGDVPRAGPPVRVFGRLPAGVSIEQAQVELTALGQRASTAFPDTHGLLRPQVLPYASSFLGATLTEAPLFLLQAINVLPVLLLVVLCGNVALLMFARAATRESELAVRNAIGASRVRIVTQLFTEALVLGGVAALVGLAAVSRGLRWAFGVIEAEMLEGTPLPFWYHPDLSPLTLVFVGFLVILAAGVSGVLPGLKVTRGLASRLKEGTAGGGGLRFGGIWTAVIVLQVAVTVALPPMVFLIREEAEWVTARDVGFPSERYLSVLLELDDASPLDQADVSTEAFGLHYRGLVEDLERRLEADPGVLGVTLVDRLPRTYHGNFSLAFEESVDGATENPRPVASAMVGLDYFDVIGAPVLAGRSFDSGDLSPDSRVLIVNEALVEESLGGRNPVGRRVRFRTQRERLGLPDDGPFEWYDIVGVVPDLGMRSGYGAAGVYRPTSADATYPLRMLVHTRGEPMSYAPRLRATAMEVDPGLHLQALVPLDDATAGEQTFYGFWITLATVVSGIALLLALAGIYSVMSFRVSRRTREIGVRVALGAEAARLVPQILGRPLLQVAAGLVLGSALTTLMLFNISFGPDVRVGYTPLRAAAIGVYALAMVAVCATACVVPTRRALSVEPTNALRAEG